MKVFNPDGGVVSTTSRIFSRLPWSKQKTPRRIKRNDDIKKAYVATGGDIRKAASMIGMSYDQAKRDYTRHLQQSEKLSGKQNLKKYYKQVCLQEFVWRHYLYGRHIYKKERPHSRQT